MERKKLGVAVATVALCGALGGAMALAGCATPTAATGEGSDVPNAEASEKPASEKVTQDWAEQFPLQYKSFTTVDYKQCDFSGNDGIDMLYEDGSFGVPQGHYHAVLTESGPNVRNADSDLLYAGENFGVKSMEWDPDAKEWVVDNSGWVDMMNAAGYTKGCYACRSSAFDDEYAEKGAAAYAEPMDEEFAAKVMGQVWDCKTCHGDEPGSTPDATYTMFTQLSRDTFNEFEPNERVCGQCHNTFNHRRWITDQETMDGFDPYKYGTDIDALMKAELEDGIYDVDEDTGIKIGCFDEPELEMTQGSQHAELGLTCVDCHMPKTTDPETGETYTNHNASGSPLAKDESLDLCMTCHKGQGIESKEAMVKMVREKQAAARKTLAESKERLARDYDLIKAAVQGGKTDEATLDKARDAYTYAEANLRILNSDSQGRAVHNPEKFDSYVAKANTLMDEIEATLA